MDDSFSASTSNGWFRFENHNTITVTPQYLFSAISYIWNVQAHHMTYATTL